MRDSFLAFNRSHYRFSRYVQFVRLQIWQECRQQPDDRKKGANAIHEVDARKVSQLAQQSRANPAQSKSESKEKSGNHSHSMGKQFLRIDKNRGKRRR